MKWSFIQQESPCWSGIYERLIAIVKLPLKKVTGKVKLLTAKSEIVQWLQILLKLKDA